MPTLDDDDIGTLDDAVGVIIITDCVVLFGVKVVVGALSLVNGSGDVGGVDSMEVGTDAVINGSRVVT